jgi:hypothetical protein
MELKGYGVLKVETSFGRIRYWMGWTGYPTLRLMTLAETGSLALIGAVIGSAGDREEGTLARRLLPLLQGMLVLLDWAFDATVFLHGVAATGAVFVARARVGAALYQLLRMAMVAAVESRPAPTQNPAEDQDKTASAPQTQHLDRPAPSWMAQTGRPRRNRRMTPGKRTQHASAPSGLTTPFRHRIQP